MSESSVATSTKTVGVSLMHYALSRASFVQIPFVAARDSVVANVFNDVDRTFSSASVLHEKYPGGTRYQNMMPVVNSWSDVRNAISGAYSCQPIPGEDRACTLRVWQWLDLGGWAPARLSSKANTSWFSPAFERIRAYVN